MEPCQEVKSNRSSTVGRRKEENARAASSAEVAPAARELRHGRIGGSPPSWLNPTAALVTRPAAALGSPRPLVEWMMLLSHWHMGQGNQVLRGPDISTKSSLFFFLSFFANQLFFFPAAVIQVGNSGSAQSIPTSQRGSAGAFPSTTSQSHP